MRPQLLFTVYTKCGRFKWDVEAFTAERAISIVSRLYDIYESDLDVW